MVIRLFDDPAPVVVSPVTVDCPECGGRGETVVPGSASRDMNGVWSCDTLVCGACQGTGAVSSADAAVCTTCNTETVWLGQGCPLHNDVCADCRPRGCADCADDGGWGADSYYAGRAS